MHWNLPRIISGCTPVIANLPKVGRKLRRDVPDMAHWTLNETPPLAIEVCARFVWGWDAVGLIEVIAGLMKVSSYRTDEEVDGGLRHLVCDGIGLVILPNS